MLRRHLVLHKHVFLAIYVERQHEDSKNQHEDGLEDHHDVPHNLGHGKCRVTRNICFNICTSAVKYSKLCPYVMLVRILSGLGPLLFWRILPAEGPQNNSQQAGSLGCCKYVLLCKKFVSPSLLSTLKLTRTNETNS